jgi:ATP-dependent protease ClpP protease subunit
MIRNCEEPEEPMPLMQSPMAVIRHENDIYFYSEVNQSSILELILCLKDAVKLHRDLQLRYPKNNKLGICVDLPIVIHINSVGGSAYDSLAAVDTIEQYKEMGIPIHTIIEGCAFSAATVLAVCGTKRFMTSSSSYMIHEMSSSGFSGNTTSAEKLYKSMKKITDLYEEVYSKHSKLTSKQIKSLMKKEEYFTSKEVLDLGLIDEII